MQTTGPMLSLEQASWALAAYLEASQEEGAGGSLAGRSEARLAERTGSRIAPVRPKMPEVRTETPNQIRKKKREPPLPAPSNEYSAPSLTNVSKRQRLGPGRCALSSFGPCLFFCLESVLFVQINFPAHMACPLWRIICPRIVSGDKTSGLWGHL